MSQEHLMALIKKSMAAYPEHLALKHEHVQMTYAQLEQKADNLAFRLQEAGAGPGSFVGLCLERGPDFVAGLVAVLKIGAAYVPIDPTFPEERIRSILEDLGYPVLLSDSRCVQGLDLTQTPTVLCEEEPRTASLQDPQTLGSPLDPMAPAYVLFTSGSTGKPKGVCCHHQGVVNLLQDFQNRQPIGPEDNCSWWTNTCFDVSVYEIFSALCSGACLHVVPDEIRPDPDQFMDWLGRERITSAYLPPMMVADLADWVDKHPGESLLRRLLVGVEPIPERLLQHIDASIPSVTIINGYGPTEATICATLYEIDARQKPHDNTPIGKPVRNMQIFLLDSTGKPVTQGESGEIHIGGTGLSLGYLNRPELNQQCFIPNPFSRETGSRLYKTGDLARQLQDGNLGFIGRTDFQVKLHGHRIELGEIEVELRKHPAIREAVVLLREDQPGHKRLVAYLLSSGKTLPEARDLRTFLKQSLPLYMLPSAFVPLEAMPITSSGKTDRRALPVPRPEDLEHADCPAFVPPQSSEEQLICNVFSKILGLQAVGVQDNFFELGGHSLQATRVLAELESIFGLRIALKDFFADPTVAGLLQTLQPKNSHPLSSPLPPIEKKTSHRASYPLSSPQQAIWLLQQFDESHCLFNIPLVVTLQGPLQPDLLEQALNELLQRHDSLRTIFLLENGVPVQRVQPQVRYTLPFHDLRTCSPKEQNTQFERLKQNIGRHVFDLTQAPLFQACLIRFGSEDYHMLLTFHHLIIDGWGASLFFRELGELYSALAGRKPSPDLPRGISYTDFALWQQEQLSSQRIREQLDYWRFTLRAPRNVLQLPFAEKSGPSPSFQGARQAIQLSESCTIRLHAFCRRQGVTPFMLLMAVFQTLLYLYSRQRDILVGTTIANRNHPQVSGLIGVLINSLVIRTDFSGQLSFLDILHQVRTSALEAYTHQDLPFERLVEELHIERHPGRHPLFQVLLLFQNTPQPATTFADIDISYQEIGNQTAKLDLLVNLEERQSKIGGWIEYRTDLFSAEQITILAQDFVQCLEDNLQQPEQPLRQLNRPKLLNRLSRKHPSCWVIGAGSLPLRCLELLLGHGFSVLGLISPDQANRSWAVQHGIPCFDISEDLEWIFNREPFDYLFSIVNKRILSETILQLPAHLAINYHDAPLPCYAGVHATAWALINQEKKHGITWHVIDPGLDTGAVLQQKEVPIEPEETSLSLNLKCYEAAVQAFEELLGRLRDDRLTPTPQDMAQRSLYGANQRPRAGCLISWQNTAEAIEALFRALDFGNSPNPLGLPKLFINSDYFLVKQLSTLPPCTTNHPPGTIVQLETEQMTIRAAGGDLIITRLSTLEGRPVSVLDLSKRFDLKPGDRLQDPSRSHSLALHQAYEQLCRHESFWIKHLSALNPLLIPSSGSPLSTDSPSEPVLLSQDVPEPLPRTGAFAENVSGQTEPDRLFCVLLALALARLTNEWEFDLGLHSPEIERLEQNLPGFFAAVIPWKLQLDPSRSFEEQAGETLQGLNTVSQKASYARDLVLRFPKLRSKTGLADWFCSGITLMQVASSHKVLENNHPSALTLIIPQGEKRWYGVARKETIDPGLAPAIMNSLSHIMQQMLDHPQQGLRDLSLLSRQDRKYLLETLNETKSDLGQSACYHELFRLQAEQSPDACAIEFHKDRMSYAELEAEANQLAAFLKASGLKQGDIVGVFLQRCLELPLALLAILKADGAYLPLDISYPAERIEFMLSDSGAGIILTNSVHAGSLPQHGAKVLCLDTLKQDIQSHSRQAPPSSSTEVDPAYIMYTSGSTGNPKGVLIPHRGLVNHNLAAGACYEFSASDRVLQFFSVSFDGAVEEIFATWLHGATLILPQEDIVLAADDFSRQVETLQISVLDLPTAFWQEWVNGLAESSHSLPSCLRAVIVGGEKASARAYANWYRLAQGRIRWFNTYGPTETTVVSTIHAPQTGTQGAAETDIPIGRPIANTSIYVVDEYLSPVPLGWPGELLIGGIGVALGYHNRPRLTAEKFIEDPFFPERGKVYRTGDRVRYRPDGNLEYLGRMDNQVKVRGFRIEPEEIEHCLSSHPAVVHAAVIGLKDDQGGMFLAGYYTLNTQQNLSASELKEYAAEHLPEYMIPKILTQLSEMPLLPNGKINRKNLPKPEQLARPQSSGGVRPRNDIERHLASIWETVLQTHPVGIKDNFFDLGGHSLLAVRLCAEIEKQMGRKVSLPELFQAGDIEGLVTIFNAEQDQSNKPRTVITLRGEGKASPLFFIHVLGRGFCYCKPLASRLGSNQPVYGLSVHFAEKRPLVENTVEALASLYIQDLLTIQAQGPFQLAGVSFGGMIALEMARQLSSRGKKIELLALFDTPAPGALKSIAGTELASAHWQALRDQGIAYVFGKILARVNRIQGPLKEIRLRSRFGLIQLLSRLKRQLSPVQKDFMARYENRMASRNHVPGKYDQDVLLFKCTDWDIGVSCELDPSLGWGEYVQGKLTVHEVPGDHLGMLSEPNVQVLAEFLKGYLLHQGRTA